jgi:hypothetical protein
MGIGPEKTITNLVIIPQFEYVKRDTLGVLGRLILSRGEIDPLNLMRVMPS